PGGAPIKQPNRLDVASLPQTVVDTIDAVLEEYGDVSGTTLARLVKGHGSPWEQARGSLPPRAVSQNPIPTESIRVYHQTHGVFRRHRLREAERRALEAYIDGDDEALDALMG